MEAFDLPTMKARDASRAFAGAVNRVAFAGARVVLTRRGKPIAALVSIADLERLTADDEPAGFNARDLELLKKIAERPALTHEGSEQDGRA